METMKDVLGFLNRLKFIEKTNSELIEEMRCKKRQLVFEFGNYNTATIIYALDIIDEMIFSIITKEMRDVLEKNNSLRENI